MNKHLILVKHSVPEIIESVPANRWHLSREGQLRAEQLAARLVEFRPQVLISSLEPKARETAEIVGRILRLDVQAIEGLHEHDRTASPYLSKDGFQGAVREFFLNPDQLVFGSETANEAHHRFADSVYKILDIYHDQTIAIIAHGTVISLFASHLTGRSGFSLWAELGLPSFIVLDMNTRTLLAHENIL